MRTYTYTLGGGEKRRLSAAGEYVRILTAGGVVKVTSERGLSVEMRAGDSVRAKPFEWLDLENLETGAQSVEVVVGFGQYDSNSIAGEVSVKSGAQAAALPDVSVPSSGVVAVNGASNRRELHVTNTGSVNIRWGGPGTVGAGQGAIIPPGVTAVITTAGDLEFYGDGGASTLAITEVTG